MIDRINLILKAKNITAKQFAEEIGIQPSGMSHIMGGRNNPSLDFVSKVLRRYPELDANWLLLGRGQMYGDAPMAAPVPPPAPSEATAEPTLFGNEGYDEPLPASDKQKEPTAAAPAETPVAPQPRPYAEAAQTTATAAEPAAQYAPTYVAVPPEQATTAACRSEGRRVVRMLLIYSDNTFAEYQPAESH